MKKFITLMLAAIMCLSLAACGGSNTEAQNPEPPTTSEEPTTVPEEPTTAPEEPTTAPTKEVEEAALPAGTWVDMYSGVRLTLNSDGTLLMMGEYPGNWTLDGSLLTIKFTDDNDVVEHDFELTEENGVPLLRGYTEFYPADQIDGVKAAVANKPGDLVSSDIVELTINEAALAYYATAASTDSDGKTANVDEANSPADSGNLYAAAKGRCLVCIDFTIKNTDRGSLNTGDYFISLVAVQGDTFSPVNGYDLNDADGRRGGLNLSNAPIAYDGGDFYTNDTSNTIIGAGQTARIKYVGVAGFEADLNAPFDLVVYLMNSSGEMERFIYTFGG